MPLLRMFLVAFVAGAPAPQPSCSKLVDQFCDELFSPTRLGNWDLSTGGLPLYVRRGLTDNDFSEATRRSLELRLLNRNKLPAALRNELEAIGYFRDLEAYLHSPPVTQSTMEEILRRRRWASTLPVLWSTAMSAATMRDMERAHPGVSRIRNGEWPTALVIEEKRLRDEIMRQAHHAIWDTAPEWMRAVEAFKVVRGEIKAWLKGVGGISSENRARIEADLDSMRLFPPGTRGIPSEACATTVVNASYRASSNSVEICAGQLTTPTLHEVLAHEIAHSMGLARQLIRLQDSLPLAKVFDKIRGDVCSGRKVACDDWARAKTQFPDLLSRWKLSVVEPQALFSCLQDRALKPFAEAPLAQQAARRATGIVQYLASSGAFLRLTRKETVARTGVRFDNPSYLNPCEDSEIFIEEPILSDTATAVLGFLAEHECAPATMTPAARLESAIVATQKQQALFDEQSLALGGPFSRDEWLNTERYAQNVDEDFADYVSAQIFARLLAKQPSLQTRRSWALATVAGFCEAPSWSREFPEEYAVQSQFTTRVHSLEGDRRRRFFQPLGRMLGCAPDLELKACVWPAAGRSP